MGVTVTIKETDRGLNRIVAQMRALSRQEVTVGVHGTGETGKNERGQSVTVKPHQGSEGPIDMPSLATIHEFGTAKIPERSFIRAGVDKGHGQIEKAYNKGVGAILDGTGNAKGAAVLLGVVMVGQMRAVIFAGIAPELAESTKKRREKSKLTGKRLKSGNASESGYTPLVDTGQLQGSLAFQVGKRRAR